MSVGLQRLRDDADTIRNGAHAKGEDPQLVDAAIAADEERRRLLGDVDGLRAQRKEISAQVGAAMKAGGAGADELKARSTEIGTRIEAGRRTAPRARRTSSTTCCCASPTRPTRTCRSAARSASVIVRTWGEPAARADGRAEKPHWEVAESARACSTSRLAPRWPEVGFPIYVGAGAVSSAP